MNLIAEFPSLIHFIYSSLYKIGSFFKPWEKPCTKWQKCLFVTEEIQYHGGLRSRELGKAPILLCVPNSQAGVIISPASTDGLTVLATGQRQYAKLVHYQPSYNTAHTMKQLPTAARRWHFALRDVSHRQICHPWVPPIPGN